jgi:hypothetical protein
MLFFELINNENNNIPFIISFTIKRNMYKKPQTNIWNYIIGLFPENNINIESSLYIGTNLGRIKNYLYNKDDSDIDRRFAYNIGIKNIRSPEQIFMNDYSSRIWLWNSDIISPDCVKSIIKDQKTNGKEIPFSSFLQFNLLCPEQIIMISGPPLSGKTLLAHRIKDYISNSLNYTNNINILKLENGKNKVDKILLILKQQYEDKIENSSAEITGEEKIITIIVGEFGRKNLREPIVEFFKESYKNNVYKSIIFIEIQSTKNISMLLNQFRLQITNNSSIIETSIAIITSYFNSQTNILSDDLQQEIKYVKFPLFIREKKELFYLYC